MIRVIVAQTTVREIKGKNAAGKDYHFAVQTAYAETVDEQGNKAPYPERIEVTLNNGQPPFAPGEYTLHPSAIYVDRNGRLAVSPRLTPIKARASA